MKRKPKEKSDCLHLDRRPIMVNGRPSRNAKGERIMYCEKCGKVFSEKEGK